ncbi:MAG: hypothetical protein ABI321_20965 [Polyangia bacterium]
MRACIGVGLAWMLAAQGIGHAMIEPNDDPKCARGECLPFLAPSLDEDDPKLALRFRRMHPVAHLDVSYRYLAVADPYGGALPFHLVEIDGFPLSHYFRLGISAAAGSSTREGAFLAEIGLGVGVQYPARVTPFLDVKLSAGVIGATIEGKREVSYEYRPTIEAGIEVFVASSFHFTAAVGYAHPIYGGVDGNVIKAQIAAGETPTFNVHSVGWDTVTVRAGFGF